MPIDPESEFKRLRGNASDRFRSLFRKKQVDAAEGEADATPSAAGDDDDLGLDLDDDDLGLDLDDDGDDLGLDLDDDDGDDLGLDLDDDGDGHDLGLDLDGGEDDDASVADALDGDFDLAALGLEDAAGVSGGPADAGDDDDLSFDELFAELASEESDDDGSELDELDLDGLASGVSDTDDDSARSVAGADPSASDRAGVAPANPAPPVARTVESDAAAADDAAFLRAADGVAGSANTPPPWEVGAIQDPKRRSKLAPRRESNEYDSSRPFDASDDGDASPLAARGYFDDDEPAPPERDAVVADDDRDVPPVVDAVVPERPVLADPPQSYLVGEYGAPHGVEPVADPAGPARIPDEALPASPAGKAPLPFADAQDGPREIVDVSLGDEAGADGAGFEGLLSDVEDLVDEDVDDDDIAIEDVDDDEDDLDAALEDLLDVDGELGAGISHESPDDDVDDLMETVDRARPGGVEVESDVGVDDGLDDLLADLGVDLDEEPDVDDPSTHSGATTSSFDDLSDLDDLLDDPSAEEPPVVDAPKSAPDDLKGQVAAGLEQLRQRIQARTPAARPDEQDGDAGDDGDLDALLDDL